MIDRDFVWAKIDIPGTIDLYAISVHLLTSNANDRNSQAGTIVNQLIPSLNAPANSYFVLGGDFNTDNRTESCISTFSSKFSTAAPYPVGQDGNFNTNAGRAKPYDWVVPNANLNAVKSSTVYGSFTYANGLVFDTRDFTQTQLDAAFSPALVADSGADQMQHMAVVRTFIIPQTAAVSDGDTVVVSATDKAPASVSAGSSANMLSITVTPAAHEWDVASVRINRYGTLPDAGVSAKIYADMDGNGLLGTGDTLLGSSAFASSTGLINLNPSQRAYPGAPVRLLAVAEVSGSAADSSTLQFQLAANGIVHAASGGADTDPTFSAVNSSLTTIVNSPITPPTGTSVVINKYFNSGTTGDTVELLVVQDNLNMSGMILKDFSGSMASDGGGNYTFANDPLWTSLRAGTLIVLRNNATTADVTVGGSDYKLDVGLANSTYFTGTGPFDIAGTEMVMIKSAASGTAGVTGSIHALASGTAGAQYTAAPQPKLLAATATSTDQFAYAENSNGVSGMASVLSNYGTPGGLATGAATGITFGSPNNTANAAFITFLRGTTASAANNVTSTGFTANWPTLTTAASYRIDVATNASFTSLVSGKQNMAAGSGTSFNITGLTGGTYYYRVRGVNAEGTVSGNTPGAAVTLTSGIENWDIY